MGTIDELDAVSTFARVIDAVFVPRPLRIVPALPRNELGKLPRERLIELLAKHED